MKLSRKLQQQRKQLTLEPTTVHGRLSRGVSCLALALCGRSLVLTTYRSVIKLGSDNAISNLHLFCVSNVHLQRGFLKTNHAILKRI